MMVNLHGYSVEHEDANDYSGTREDNDTYYLIKHLAPFFSKGIKVPN